MKGLRLSVTELNNFVCPRHNVLAILRKLKRFPKFIEPNRYLLSGNLMHTIMQEVMLRRFSYVEYSYYRENRDLETSLRVNLDRTLSDWQNLYVYGTTEYSDIPEEVEAAIERTQKGILNLAQLCLTLTNEEDGQISSLAVGDEFVLQTLIGEKLLLTGHVDLAALESNQLRLIELKTGNEYSGDSAQLNLYGEMFATTQNRENVVLELWYSKAAKIKKPKPTDHNLLESIEASLSLALSNPVESELPPIKKNDRCRYCDLCNIQHLLIKEYTEDKSIKDFF